MRSSLALFGGLGGVFALGCAGLGSVNMDEWESQVLGAVYGTYCGYRPDQLTQVGANAHLTDAAQCKAIFDPTAKACVEKAKAAGQWHVSGPVDGRALGEQIGTCIDEAYTAALGPPTPQAATAFAPWENQVLGAIHGTYCGYFPDRMTVSGKNLGFTSYAQCTKLFDATISKCVTPEVQARFVPGDTTKGGELGGSIGSCFDLQLPLALLTGA